MTVPEYAARHARRAQGWVARLASGDCSTRELDRLQRWLARDPRHRAAFEQQRRQWQALGAVRSEVLAARPGLLRPVHRPVASWQAHRFAWGAACAALVLALAVFGPGLWVNLRSDVRSDAQPRSMVLADGTRVVLDAHSAIAVRYAGDRRRIRLLRGRAWFDVVHAPARPFQVEALGGRTLDIGTGFAVGIRDGEVRTVVGDGEVEVRAQPGGIGRRVRAGESVSYREGGEVSAVAAASADAVAAWRHGEILLVGVDGRSAIARIAEYRQAPVWVLGDVASRGRITATFRIDSADRAIAAVAEQLGLELRRLPGGVLLLHPGAARAAAPAVSPPRR